MMTMMQRFKQMIVVTWGLWWTIALATDFSEALQDFGLFQATWRAQNYPFLSTTLGKYGLPAWISVASYVGIITWMTVLVILFWRAMLTPYQNSQRWFQRVNSAFITGLMLWFAFYLADQMVLDFNLEANHMVQGTAMFVSFLALYLLPDEFRKIQ